MRKTFSKKAALLPLPVYIIGTYDEAGKANAMNLAWGTQCGYHEVSLSIAKEHKTMKNILLKKEFTISLATKATKDIADYFGIESGNKVDKIEKSGVHIVKVLIYNFNYFILAPSLNACPTFSPSIRYEFVIESKVISSNLSTSISPFSFKTLSSANVFIISATTL